MLRAHERVSRRVAFVVSAFGTWLLASNPGLFRVCLQVFRRKFFFARSLSLSLIANISECHASYFSGRYLDETILLVPSYATHFLPTCVNLRFNPLGMGHVFRSRNLVESFAKFSKFSLVFRRFRTCSDLFGRVWMHLDAFGCVRMNLDTFGKHRKCSQNPLRKNMFFVISARFQKS